MKKVILTIIIALTGMITAQAQRFALIDMEYILKHIPAYEQANRQMESLSQQYQKEIEAKGQEAKSLYEAYQQSASTLSDSQRTEKENAIVAKEKEAADLRARYFGPEGEMAKKQKELITPIQDAIYNAVKTVATQQGYDVVFDRASDQSMIFASDICLATHRYQ